MRIADSYSMIALVPKLASSLRSPAKAGIAGITTITLNFSPFLAARKIRSTSAEPMRLFLMGDCLSPVAVMKN